MTSVIRYGSSLRTAPIAETLAHARRLAPQVGVTRVTEITRLDRIGLPVFAGIRPHAQVRSLCVSSGKGLTPDEARIGAYMEAIELAYAEPARANLRIVDATARDVLDGALRPDAIAELAPWDGKRIAPTMRLPCVELASIAGGDHMLVPAELVMFPVVAEPLVFGSDGNGVASGNSVDEATVHGLTELIERDATSFANMKDDSRRIDPTSLPEATRALVQQLDELGFDLAVRYLPNPFGLPVIKAMLYERDTLDGVHFGYACHLGRDIALARAVSEAVQCRLSVIHGGRDDLTRVFFERSEMTPVEKREFVDRQVGRNLRTTGDPMRFDEVPDESAHATSIATALELLLARLARNGMRIALRAVLTPSDSALHVIRVVVPGLEVYAHGVQRMGPRLIRDLLERAQGTPESRSSETSR
jgi:ribosomal protein S12 methylthiotransferase accessory factor